MNDRVEELDSIRGIAILAVIALHTFSQVSQYTGNHILGFMARIADAGWIGVDMFFTLSGFLITSILLRTKAKGHYFKNFYMRRVLRILPLYYTLILALFIFAPYLDPGFRSQFPGLLPVLVLFQQNWTAVFLDAVPISTYLWVTWSLAVEEQFYFILPFVVYRLGREALLKSGLAYIALSIVIRILGVAFLTNIAQTTPFMFFYYNSFTRFDEFIVGALLAVLMTYDGLQTKIRRYALPVFFASFLVCLVLFISAKQASTFPVYGNIPITLFGYTAIAFCTAGLIGACVTYPKNSLFRRLFQNKVLLFFGKYSYAMYLFHVPFALAFSRVFQESGMLGAKAALAYIGLVLASTVTAALLAWNLIEKHALSLKKYFEYE